MYRFHLYEVKNNQKQFAEIRQIKYCECYLNENSRCSSLVRPNATV